MYILIIARGYPTEKYKMNGIFEFDQAKALAEYGHKVVYAAIDVRSIRRWRKWGIENIKKDNLEIYAINIPGGRIPKKILQMISTFGLNILYKKILKEQGKPDIMHAHFANVGYVVSKFKEKSKIPFVMTEHLSAMMKPNIDESLYKIANYAYKNTDALITVSPGLKNVINEKFNINSVYIPNIVDTKLFSYLPNKKNDDFRFVSIGNLIYRKRMDITIKAFYSAFNENKNTTLTIFGDGPERINLEKLIDELGIRNQVELMGLQSRNTISKYLQKSDCFVLASEAETFGVVYIEALASGVPVIATRCGGPESFVNKKNGIIVPVDDIEALKSAMEEMYYNNKRYDKKIVSEEAKRLFSPNAVASQLTEVYNTVI